ncbi:MAG: ABC transporter permease, partial [Blastocatellia bacterium]
GVAPALGRTFNAEEETEGKNHVAIISDRLWKRQFGGVPGITGRAITINGQAFTVAGIMAPEFEWPMTADVWTPLALTPENRKDRSNHWLSVLGRIKPTLNIAEAKSEMGVVAGRLAAEYPQTNSGRVVNLEVLPGDLSSELSRAFLFVLMGAVAFVLLIACANVANLQLARAAGRQKEIAIRTALGASRWRIARQVTCESVLLSLLGAVPSVVLAIWGIALIKSAIPPEQAKWVPGLSHMRLDASSLLFAIAIAVGAGIISGLAPAIQAARSNQITALKEGGRGSAAGASGRLRSVFVVAEVALALVLTVGTGLMVKGFQRMAASERQGFDSNDLLIFRVTLPESRYPKGVKRADFYRQLVDRIEAVDGVKSAAATDDLPASGNWSERALGIEGVPDPLPSDPRICDYESSTPHYFDTLHIQLVSGREFGLQDDQDSQPVAIISRGLAEHYWPGQSPIGRRIRVGQPDATNPWRTIVGVVGDVKQFLFDAAPRETAYVPHAQAPDSDKSVVVRSSSGNPMNLVPPIRAAVTSVDNLQPIFDIGTLNKLIDNQASGIRLSAGLMLIFGFVALLLASVGIYSVIAYSVTQRTHEIGVRMALGAARREIAWMVIGQAAKFAGVGMGIGLPIAFALAKVLAGVLVGAVRLEAPVFIGVTGLLAAVSLFSAYLPAHRASRVDPMIALRYE